MLVERDDCAGLDTKRAGSVTDRMLTRWCADGESV